MSFDHTMHPTTSDLDRLHAGWLDDSPETKHTLLAHLANCAQCQRDNAQWRKLIGHVVAEPLEPGLPAELKLRRRLALNGLAATRRAPAHGPRWMVALAAMLTAAVVGLGTLYNVAPPTPSNQVALSEPDEDDLYADFDFYLWLLETHGAATGDPSKG